MATVLLQEASVERHIAMFTFPFASHPSTLLALTRRLAAAAVGSPPSSTVFSFFSTERSNSALFRADSSLASLNIRPFNVHDGLPEGYVPRSDPKRMWLQAEPMHLFIRAAPANLRRAAAEAEDAVGCRISCVVSDAFLWVAGSLAEERGVPWVAVRTGGPRSLVAHFQIQMIPSTIRHLATIGSEDPEVPDFIPGFSSTECRDLPDGNGSILHSMARNLHRATAIVVNSFEEADPVITQQLHSKFQNYLSVGPFGLLPQATSSPNKYFSHDPNGCIPWLECHEPNSVVYISFGTIVKPKTSELMALMESLTETGHPFLWSFCGDLVEELSIISGGNLAVMEKALVRGKMVRWAPQLAVLRHPSVGVFVTHCGWNSLLESIAGGVPMIGRPFFADQPLNQTTMEDEWKIGLGVEGGVFTKQGTVRALEMVLSREEGKKMRLRVGALNDALVKSMEPDGSSSQNFNKLMMEIFNSKKL
ncbi:hypothetical protein SAY86_017403 [Trapa natans]|uniref:Glycosyltransferase n=1 Tax=Trapa natans TaxID=22666 RepID=A0AAN7R2N9_TRANT|nr:hypothetical protein SAY86_017403 [Trapa natans]